MKQLFYLPLEILDKRYTLSLDQLLMKSFSQLKVKLVKIIGLEMPGEIKTGAFLDSDGTNFFKFSQLQTITRLFRKNKVKDGDIFFISDLWFPGIEAIKYMAMFHNITIKIIGLIHAGSWTNTDYVRELEPWAKDLEISWFKMFDEIYCGSNFLRNDLITKKRVKYFRRLKVTGLPFNRNSVKQFTSKNKKDIIIFNGRLNDEKQPWLFDQLKVPNSFKKIKTMELNLKKDDYYKLLGESKFVFSSALQENFGFGIIEAVTLGCIPILPNRLVYPEFYPKEFLYNNLEEAEKLIEKFYKKYKPTDYITKKHDKNLDNIIKEVKKFL